MEGQSPWQGSGGGVSRVPSEENSRKTGKAWREAQGQRDPAAHDNSGSLPGCQAPAWVTVALGPGGRAGYEAEGLYPV